MTLLMRLCLAWAAGIGLAAWWLPPGPIWLWGLLPLLGGGWLYRNSLRGRSIFAYGLMFWLGVGRLLLAQPHIQTDHLAFYNDGPPLWVVGRIVAEPDARDGYTNLTIAVSEVTLSDGQRLTVHGRLLARVPSYPRYHFGETLQLFGSPETPPVFPDFSYKAYLARRNIHSLMRRPQVTVVEAASPTDPRVHLYRFKNRAHHTLQQLLPDPHAALLGGILLGLEDRIETELYEQFNQTGTSHIIVISGSNISLLVGLLLLAGQPLVGRRRAAWLATLGVVLYTLLVGPDAAVVRAAVMGLLYVWAMFLGRPNDVRNSLFAAALGMTLHNPWVLWDVGFQLSFAATLGLVLFVPPLEHLAATVFRWQGGWLQNWQDLLREAILVTIAAQIATTPLLLFHFGRLSLIGLLANLLIVPAQPLVMIAGGLAVLAGLLWLPAGQLLGLLAWVPLHWTLVVVEFMAALPGAELALPPMPLWLMVLLYLNMGLAWWWLAAQYRQRPLNENPTDGRPGKSGPILLGLAVLFLLGWGATRHLPNGHLHVFFLDVGQGDAIFIQTPQGRQILIDGGPSAARLGSELGAVMPFWDRSLDVVISTHPDADHLTGLVSVVQRYRVGMLLNGNTLLNTDLFAAWQNALAAQQVVPQNVSAGSKLELEPGLSLQVLHPTEPPIPGERSNQRSLVLVLEYDALRILLPGDIETGVEQRLLRNSAGALPAAVLKSPHHGSLTSSSVAFLAEVQPQLVIVSVGNDNRFGHPAPEVLARYQKLGSRVLRTDEHGRIHLRSDGQQFWVNTQR